MKRSFDIIFSLLAITVFLLPVAIVIILLKFKEKHSILFKQERIGIDNCTFEILKFQSMVDEEPTKTGRILRKTGIDELPQFLNVLKGDMSIVGPRALTHFDIERLKWNDCFHSKRWNVKPGITGLAQIYGGQHRKTSWFWDVKYSNNSNMGLDFLIVAISFLMNVFGKTRVRTMIWSKKKLK